MGVHPWPAVDPASAYLTMTGGAGAAPMHAASAALSSLGGSVDTTVAASGVNDVVVGEHWSGMGRIMAAASVGTLNTDQMSYGQLSLLKAQLLQAAGELHTMTPPRMVTHVQANANRGEYLVDNAINPWVWGALTPRLMELDSEYFGFMWPNNASAGLSYGAGLDALGAALAGLSALPSLAGGSVAAPGLAAADVGANAGITMASAVMSTTEQAATATIAPATTATTSSTSSTTSNALLGDAPLAAPVTSNSSVQPLAAVHNLAPASPSAPALSQPQAPVLGMFAPPPSAAVSPPTPSPALPISPPAAAVAPPMPAAAPGVTSYVPPAQPFSPPPPTAGRATGLAPGMLNAAALRGPVSTAPLTTTTTATSGLTGTQPLAYVSPDPPRPPVPSTPSQQLPLNPGDVAPIQHIQPSHVAPATPPPSPAPQQGGPSPGPSTGGGDPNGSGGPGAQMPGSVPGQAPQAPPVAIPLDTRPPIPPPPEPGQPPLQPPSPPSWAHPPVPQSVQAALDELDRLEKLIQLHNSKPPDPSNLPAVFAYNAEADYYNSWAAQLHGKLDSSNTQYTPATTAKTAQIPSWTQPAPPQPVPQGPQPPQQAQNVLKQIDEGKWPQGANAPGTKGGSSYENRDGHLPTTDGSGKPITYQEWDVDPKVPGQNRVGGRIVTGSDGSAWYTPDHYATFQRLR
jgi:guanyl-specific ribonuclease Sa